MNIKKRFTSKHLVLTALLLSTMLVACGGSSGKKTNPEIITTNPKDSAMDTPINQRIVAVFSESMKADSIGKTDFTVASSTGVVTGVVSFHAPSNTVIFQANANLESLKQYTATISKNVLSSSGRPMLKNHVWVFTTSNMADSDAPEVISTNPSDTEIGFAVNRDITANFSEGLDPATVNNESFTVSDGANNIKGVVSYKGDNLIFKPNKNLTIDTLYTARLKTTLADLAVPANNMASEYVWTFTSGAGIASGPARVNLRTAGDFVILTKTGVTNVHTSDIRGNIGASPITAAALNNVFCTEITGTIYGANDAYVGSGLRPCFTGTEPDITYVANAVLDMETAYTNAAGRSLPDFTELYAGDISGQTLAPGLYKWGTGLLISTDVTLSGGANDVWIFQIAGDLTQEGSSSVILEGGALPENIFWQVGGGTGVALGTNTVFKGVVLAQKGITVNTGATVTGNLLSQTAVTLEQNIVTSPSAL